MSKSEIETYIELRYGRPCPDREYFLRLPDTVLEQIYKEAFTFSGENYYSRKERIASLLALLYSLNREPIETLLNKFLLEHHQNE